MDVVPGPADPREPAPPRFVPPVTFTLPDPPLRTVDGPPPEPLTRRRFKVPRWLVVIVAIALVGAAGYGLGALTRDDSSSAKDDASRLIPPAPNQPNGPSTSPALPNVPGAAALSGLVVQQRDVPASVSVQLIPNGNEVSNEVGGHTLDLCNGTFPSEAARTVRLQVAAVDQNAGVVELSTEAVLYNQPSDTTQAFAELGSVAASCPGTPVRSPVGGATVTTRFNPAPDSSWADVPGVDRLAYDFTVTDERGQTTRNLAVYLRRGRALMGLYFPDPTTTLPQIRGQTTIPAVVAQFANRMTQLPTSVTG